MRSAILAALSLVAYAAEPNVQEIVQKSSAAMERNWKAAPDYAFIERDVQSKRGGEQTIKTYQVMMIEGSNYNRLIALNDQPLSKEMDAREQEKLEREIERRKHESKSERAKRVAKYQRERTQDHTMMKEMVNAFDFKLAGEDTVAGRHVWVLEATPKPDYQPINHEAKVLTGMRGTMWIDKEQFQWVKVVAEVTKPVSMFLVAKVSPGTKFILEQSQVSDGLWLPKHFSVKVNASALGFINENSTDDETYHDYKPMSSLHELTARAR